MEINIDTDNHYTHHLSKVNERNAVLASEDICNTQGAIVVPKGQPINPEMAKRIAQHKLSKAIDHSVTIEHYYSARQMYECMQDHLEVVGLHTVISNFQLEKVIKTYLEYACKQPMIRLKLSVLAECFPVIFNRTLISASIALAICKEMKTDSDTAKDVFLAALLADTGLLHIDPEVAAQRGQFSPEQWALYQGHVAISKSFADMVPKLSKQVGKAVMEHHERSDGFGYPLQKFGDQLCLEGRILAKVDTIMAVYRKRILQEGYAFSVIIPVLQFSSANNNANVNNAAMRLLYKVSSGIPPKASQQPVLELIPKLISILKRLDIWLKKSKAMLENYKQQLSKPEAKRHVQMYLRLKHDLDSSGLLSVHQHRWLLEVLENQNKDEFHVVEQFSVMLYEIEFQCLQAHRHFSPLIPELFGNGDDAQFIRNATDKIGTILNA